MIDLSSRISSFSSGKLSWDNINTERKGREGGRERERENKRTKVRKRKCNTQREIVKTVKNEREGNNESLWQADE